MYSYYGLTDDVRERLEQIERDLQRPIWVLPGDPAAGLGSRARRRLAETRQEVSLEHLTAEQAEEMTIVIAMNVPETCPTNLQTTQFCDSTVHVRVPTSPEAFPLTWARPESDDVEVGFVRPGRVYCTIADMAYFPNDHADSVAVWDVLIEAVTRAADPALEAEFDAARRVRIRERVAELVGRNNSRAIDTRRQQITVQEDAVRLCEQQLRDALINVRQSTEELDLLLRMRDEGSETRLIGEYDALVSHPRITSVDLTSVSNLELKTDMVTMTHPSTGETRTLGRFKVDIDLTTSRVRLTNLDNPRHGRQHPHVSGTDPCFGGHERTFTQVLVAGRWSVYLELLFQYLETFNLADDWGRYGAYWFDEPDWDPEAEPAADTRLALRMLESGVIIRVGDRVSFVPEEYGDNEHYRVAGIAVDDGRGRLNVVRDDGHVGSGVDGAWMMDEVYEETIRLEATTAVAA